jgi:hypothetical protein
MDAKAMLNAMLTIKRSIAATLLLIAKMGSNSSAG